jgi:hypothetical protein
MKQIDLWLAGLIAGIVIWLVTFKVDETFQQPAEVELYGLFDVRRTPTKSTHRKTGELPICPGGPNQIAFHRSWCRVPMGVGE